MTQPTIRLLALLLMLRMGNATTPALLQAQTIWVEGKKPARATMSWHPWWYDQVKKNLLSGSDWISKLYSGPQKVDHPGHLHLLRLFPFQPP